MDKDALAARLRATFLDELDEQVRTLNADLLALESTPGASERLRSVFRVVHTLKGAARAGGAPLIEVVCHELETALVEIRDGRGMLTETEFATLFSAADALGDAGRRLRKDKNDTLASSPLVKLAEQLTGELHGAPTGGDRAILLPAPAPAPAPVTMPTVSTRDQAVRVAADQLDALLAATGELTVVGSGIAGRPADAEALRNLASTWTTEWRQARVKLRRALEHTQVLDAVNTLGWMDENLRRFASTAERLAGRLADDARSLMHVTNQITDQVRRVRLRPFAEACEALPRVVRDVALHARKEVALEIEGGDVEADRAVLDALREALLHLVRNAIDHGIESPTQRAKLGKPQRGTVRIAAVLRGDRLVVTVSDDGAGIDVPAIQARLEQRGLSPGVASSELGRLLLQGGFSTRTEAGPISGRGVGLDAVRGAAERIRGSLDLEWSAGRGTTFTLTCPPSLATVRVLLVALGARTFGFPCTDVERIVRLRPNDLKQAGGRDVVVLGAGEAVPLASLAVLLGRSAAESPTSDHLIAVILAVNGRRVGVLVDRAIEEREIVLRPMRNGRMPLPLVAGAAPLGTGRVAVLLDAPAVVTAGLNQGVVVSRAAAPTPAEQVRPRILVVDDSLTTRALEQSLLEAAGYDVRTAVDGAQAWEALQEGSYDLVVADVEMPRMDGFTLCETIRGSRRHAKLPVILVTALDAPEHRARGLGAGADAYLVKSGFDQQALLNTVQQLLG